MPPKVFVSYSHDSDAHKARVRAFVARLRGDGIDVVYDEDVARIGGPDEGWPRWCRRQIEQSNYVLACCTAMFHERYEGEQPVGVGHGVAWEANSIRQYLYENPHANQRVRNLILEEGDLIHIPSELRPYHVFLPNKPDSYAELLGWLKGALAAVGIARDAATDVAVAWLPPAEDFTRGMADRSDEFERFRNMLAGRDPHRALLVQGPSNSGKSELMRECIRYAQHCGVPFSHIDFKGGLPLEDVFDGLLLDFQDMLPKTSASERQGRASKVIADLLELRKPCLFAFDTYQEAPQRGQNWIENELLPRIGRCPALVVAVAGQTIPEHEGRSWAPLAYATALRPITSVDDWCDLSGASTARPR
jgi:TIR domain